jgi:hypothetical protein
MKAILGEEVYRHMEDRVKTARSNDDGRNYEGTSARDASECKASRAQEILHAQGYRKAELVQSLFGWGVRATSGLDGFVWLASCRRGDVDGTHEDALRWAKDWVAGDPDHRCVVKR